MSLITFIKGLTPRIGRNEIAKSCELTLNALRDTTIPAYKSAYDLFKVTKLASPEAKRYQSDLRRSVKGASADMFETVLECLQNAESFLQYIEKRSDTLFADAEASIALTYQKATYTRLVAAIGFGTEYARRFLNYIYLLETAQADSQFDLKTQLTPAETEYVEKYFNDFCIVLASLNRKLPELEKNISELPDAVVTEMTEKTFPATLGPSRVDPLGFNHFIVPIDWTARANPFYLIGTVIASFQVKQYNIAKDELDLLQMRKLNLEKQRAGKPDANLERQIEHTADRIGTLRYEIERLEEKYGI